MKQFLFFGLVLVHVLSSSSIVAQSVGISDDGSIPEASAMLDVKSTNKGLLIPRTDTSSVNLAGSPADGLLIYSEVDDAFYFYNGSRWVSLNGILVDQDGDTKVEVEKGNDDDRVRMTIGGEEALVLEKSEGGQVIMDMSYNKRCLFIGRAAGSKNGLDSTFSNSGHLNTGIGYSALSLNTNGLSNTAVGSNSMTFNTTGSSNTAVGSSSLQNNTIGFGNAAIGNGALMENLTGYDNVAMGLNALNANKTGFFSVALGRRAGVFDTISMKNVYIGGNAGSGGATILSRHDKANNVMIGYDSGVNAHGDNNVFLGYESGKNELGNNKLYIENSDAGSSSALIYGEFDNDILRVNGKLGVSTTGTPSDRLHVVGSGSENLLRVQLGTDTKMRIFNNGSISLGSNNTGISAGDVYVSNDLGIGVSVPSNRLHVRGSGNAYFMAKIENLNTESKSSGLIIEVGPNINPGTDNVFINFQDQNGTHVGSVTGDGSGGVQFNTTSDKRLKQNIQPFKEGINTINQIEAYNYEMKSNPGTTHIGFIAQELYEILPTSVKGTPETTSEENPMMVDYSKITPVLLAAVKELIEKNKQLESAVADLTAQNQAFNLMNEELKSQRRVINDLLLKVSLQGEE